MLDVAVQEMNNGADILRSGFSPETAFAAIHNVLSILTQNVADDVENRRGFPNTDKFVGRGV